MKLKDMSIAILAAKGFEQSELEEPKKALEAEGAKVRIISPEKTSSIKGWSHDDWGRDVKVDIHLDDADAEEFDALVLPGGVMNPDALRVNPKAVNFVKHFISNNKPIGAICHAPWTLIDADGVKGRKMTSYASIKTDLINAGAKWVDQEVVADGMLITSRKPDDLPAFNKKIIELFAEYAEAE